MRLDRARHADRAEQKRDKSDEIEEAIKIIERFAEILLPFRDRVVFESETLDLRREFFHFARNVQVRRELHEIQVAREAAGLKQVRLREILQRNVNPRRETRG